MLQHRPCCMQLWVSWSMLGHVLSEEQSKDGSNRVSDDGRLTIVQCHLYHWPPSLDLYRSSVRIISYSNTTTNKSTFLSLPLPTSTTCYSTTAQPEPYHAPHTFHVSGQSYHACTSSQGHGFQSPQGLVRI